MSQPQYQFTTGEFGTLLSWYMVSDPWPLSDDEDDTIHHMLEAESKARGYDSWVHAYHDINMEEAPQ
jgi:hypothetical protein